VADANINVRLSLANPDVLRKLEAIKSTTRNINFNLQFSNPEVFNKLQELDAKGKTINLAVNSSNAVSELTKLESKFKELKDLSVIDIRIGSDAEQTLRNIQTKILKSLPKDILGDALGSLKGTPLESLNSKQIDQVRQNAQNIQSSLSSVQDVIQEYSKQLGAIKPEKPKTISSFTAGGEDFERETLKNKVREQESKLRDEIRTKAGTEKIEFTQTIQQGLESAVGRITKSNIQSVQQSGANFANRPQKTPQQQARELLAQQELEEDFTSGNISRSRLIGRAFDPLFPGTAARIDERIGNQQRAKGLSEGEIGKLFQKAQGAKLFDLKRIPEALASEEGGKAITEAGIAGLSGLSSGRGLLGGVISGAVRGAGALASLATPLGAAGSFLTSGVAEAVLTLSEHLFENISKGLEGLIELGAQFQESVLAVQATLQFSSPVQGLNGQQLTGSQELAIQERRARDIIGASRARLAPLGIGGAGGATLVSAVASASGLRGFDIDPEKIAKLSQRFGAAAGVFNPQLLQNPAQLRRDVEDILLGLPQAGRTTLGAAIRPVVNKVAFAKTADEVDEATKELDKFVQTLRDSPSAIVQFNRIAGATSNTFTLLGDSLLQLASGPLKLFADAATNFSTSVQNAYSTFGELAKGIENVERVIGQSPIGKAILGAANVLTEGAIKPAGPDSEERVTSAKLKRAFLSEGGINEEEFDKLSLELKFSATDRLKAARNVRDLSIGGETPTDLIGAEAVRAKALQELEQEERTFSVGGLSGQAQDLERSRRFAQTNQADLQKGLRGVEANLATPDLSPGQKDALNNLKTRLTRDLASSLSRDLETSFGNVDLSIARGEQKQRQVSKFDQVGQAQAAINALQGGSATAASEISRIQKRLASEVGLDPADRAALEARLQELREVFTEIRVKTEDAIKQAILTNIDQSIQGIDTSTIAGKKAGNLFQREKTRAELEFSGVSPEKADSFVQLQFQRAEVNRQLEIGQGKRNLRNAQESDQNVRTQARFSLQDLDIREKELPIKQEQLDIQKAELPIKFRELGLKTEQLALSFGKADQSIADFIANADSRKFQRGGSVVSALQKVQSANPDALGGVLGEANSALGASGLPLINIDENGQLDSSAFEAASALVELKASVRNLRQGPSEDARTLEGLKLDRSSLDLQAERLPLERRGLVASGNQLGLDQLKLDNEPDRIAFEKANVIRGVRDSGENLANTTLQTFQQFAGTGIGNKLLEGGADSQVSKAATALGVDPALLTAMQESAAKQAQFAEEFPKLLIDALAGLNAEAIQGAVTGGIGEASATITSAVSKGLSGGLN
jgi:uncharacterized protein YwlG (UPF0340 family)